MDPHHPFDGKRGPLCSCGHVRSEHVERYEPGEPLSNMCRECGGR